jgi:hypothetical protein
MTPQDQFEHMDESEWKLDKGRIKTFQDGDVGFPLRRDSIEQNYWLHVWTSQTQVGYVDVEDDATSLVGEDVRGLHFAADLMANFINSNDQLGKSLGDWGYLGPHHVMC